MTNFENADALVHESEPRMGIAPPNSDYTSAQPPTNYPPAQPPLTNTTGSSSSEGPYSSMYADGPFSGPVNAMLTKGFGQSLSGISVRRGEGARNRGIGAEAHTIERKISLGDGITEDPRDAHSMEVITHEVAHALAGGGSGRDLLNQADDPGETAAYAASGAMRLHIEGGGPLPRLRPALGGQATIHRYEGGEHIDAVDNATKLLKDEGVAVDPKVAARMSQKVKLANGLEVTPGDITAMMGDFYGAFDKGKDGKEHFNPEKSFDELNKANPEEMKRILARIHREYDDVQKAKDGKGEFKATATSEFDELTEDRKVTKDKDGTTTGHNFLELAKRNANHFNKKDSTNADDDMGSYKVLHRLAMEAAAAGDENKARAMEASAQHFLTDRFSAGHQFDKDKIIQAGNTDRLGLPIVPFTDVPGQIMSRFVHNQLNEHGVSMKDRQGHEWTGRGDEHWADKENKPNRLHAAQATYESYSELDAVLSGKKSPEDVKNDSKVDELVPQWDPETEKKAEKMAKAHGADDPVAFAKFLKNEGGDMAKEGAHGLGKKWHGLKNWAGDKWEGAKKTAGDVKDWGAEKLHNAGEWGHEKWEGAKKTAGEVKDWGAEKLHNAGEWGHEKWEGAKKTAGKVKDWGAEKLHNAGEWGHKKWEGAKKTAGDVKDWGAEKLHNAGEWGHEKWEGAKKTAGEVKDWGAEKLHNAGEWGHEKWEGAKQTAGDVKDWADGQFQGAEETVHSAWGWIRKKVSAN